VKKNAKYLSAYAENVNGCADDANGYDVRLYDLCGSLNGYAVVSDARAYRWMHERFWGMHEPFCLLHQ
jgi:hypothetical protein